MAVSLAKISLPSEELVKFPDRLTFTGKYKKNKVDGIKNAPTWESSKCSHG
jgi:hypothetical protein